MTSITAMKPLIALRKSLSCRIVTRPSPKTAAGLATRTSRKPLAFKYLGVVPYSAALDLQNALVQRRLDAIENPGPYSAESDDLVLLLQHPHVYTGGRRIRGEDDSEGTRLRALGAEYFETERGGQVTYHGPGQLVGYPILNLKDHEFTTRLYVRALEQFMIRLCSQFGVETTTNDNIGVWIGDEKIGAVGVQSQRGVSSHGFALNCNTDLSWFGHIVPCGMPDKGVTSLTKEVLKDPKLRATFGDAVTVDTVLSVAVRTFGDVMGWKMVPAADAAPQLAAFVDRTLASAGIKQQDVGSRGKAVNSSSTR